MSAESSADQVAGYTARKIAGMCTRCGKVPAIEDGQLCSKCRTRLVKYKRKSDRRIRAARRKAGRCAFCETKSKTYRCLACKVRLQAGRKLSAHHGADRLDRIRAQTVVGDDGRVRYHGQERRGRQSIAQLDEQDIDLAIRSLLKAKDGLALARAPENVELPRIQRREAERAALSLADLATRQVEDVLERNRYHEHSAKQEGRRP